MDNIYYISNTRPLELHELGIEEMNKWTTEDSIHVLNYTIKKDPTYCHPNIGPFMWSYAWGMNFVVSS